jgi:hypothetical protein
VQAICQAIPVGFFYTQQIKNIVLLQINNMLENQAWQMLEKW